MLYFSIVRKENKIHIKDKRKNISKIYKLFCHIDKEQGHYQGEWAVKCIIRGKLCQYLHKLTKL